MYVHDICRIRIVVSYIFVSNVYMTLQILNIGEEFMQIQSFIWWTEGECTIFRWSEGRRYLIRSIDVRRWTFIRWGMMRAGSWIWGWGWRCCIQTKWNIRASIERHGMAYIWRNIETWGKRRILGYGIDKLDFHLSGIYFHFSAFMYIPFSYL